MKFLCLLLLFNLITVYSFAQYYIEPIAGNSIDLNNKDYKFKQINSAIQFSWHTKSKHEWMLRVQRGWPLSVTSNDSSFSLNPAVPVYSAVKKDLHPASLSLAAGVRLKVAEINSFNNFIGKPFGSFSLL